MNTHTSRCLPITLACLLFALPAHGDSALEPYEQEFLITAYYSPLPGQCCYVKGGYLADKVLNGEGEIAADGTPVYPGMIAAPVSYPFGTKVRLPGVGIFTVHDRGGAIQELEGGLHRLDIWVGFGEEGLARALEFGIVRIRGTIYPSSFDHPATAFDLMSLQAPLERLEEYKLEGATLLSMRPISGERGLSVAMLQDALRDLGYFAHAVTGQFGAVTEEALSRFLKEYGLGQESSTTLSEKTAAFILAARARKDAENPVGKFVDVSSAPSVIQEAQRLLRYLGYYRGRTDGRYSKSLAAGILRFQQEHQLAAGWESPGAGRIGPLTMHVLRSRWNQKLVAARASKLLLLSAVDRRLSERGRSIEQFLSEGDSGPFVRTLQILLADRNFFPIEEINGHFGPLTKSAVTAYQIDRGIVEDDTSHGAGSVGPSTLARLRSEERIALYRLVRSEGMRVL